jgi:sugar/nucleoside kinase (ribokinase family)
MLGQLGTDTEGIQYMEYLKTNSIDSSLVIQKEGIPTGQAYILTANKDNSILLVGGANQCYDEKIPESWSECIKGADLLLM